MHDHKKSQKTNYIWGKNVCNVIYKEFLKINKRINNLLGKNEPKTPSRTQDMKKEKGKLRLHQVTSFTTQAGKDHKV